MLWERIFSRQAASAKRKIAATVSKAEASDEEAEADRIIAELDLDLTDDEKTALKQTLAEVANAGGAIGLTEVIDLLTDPPTASVRTAMFGQINSRAVAWAADSSADLVSQIDASTRDMLRDQIASALADGKDIGDVADAIEDLGVFSPERAALIAETEIAGANSMGALAGYRTAADNGVRVKKAWLTGAGACPICVANEEQGAIDLDEAFESGDDAPPAHPRCRCAIAPAVDDTGEKE